MGMLSNPAHDTITLNRAYARQFIASHFHRLRRPLPLLPFLSSTTPFWTVLHNVPEDRTEDNDEKGKERSCPPNSNLIDQRLPPLIAPAPNQQRTRLLAAVAVPAFPG